jgi:hypothetical protein
MVKLALASSVAEIFGPLNPGRKKPGSGMNIPDHISQNNFLGLNILKFFDADPGSF